ncbi:Potassium transport protein, high-affinity [Metarhizium album ARSEF 1941]|uniref:Potassium transport protein, high-affinity n=1 Tax=Metarhizium album (strain ARSEF 1941) TaxID=1081103 RepID=A0A0B2WN92_METAS|nr:Potassium transport protein, high-affinity [Metarhizium album ARSEF 1941]KHN97531.1 Potassium transport protein, high-affinity [Metarhizium album ARSEF 1941]
MRFAPRSRHVQTLSLADTFRCWSGPALIRAKRRKSGNWERHSDLEAAEPTEASESTASTAMARISSHVNDRQDNQQTNLSTANNNDGTHEAQPELEGNDHDPELSSGPTDKQTQRIAFHPSVWNKPTHTRKDSTLYIPGPRERDRDADATSTRRPSDTDPEGFRRRFSRARSFDRATGAAASIFVIGKAPTVSRLSRAPTLHRAAADQMPYLSRRATIGRNSRFHNLTRRDRQELGGIEYRSLQLLLKVVVAYFFGMHIFGAIALVGWILHADPKYDVYLGQCGQNRIWWAFYTAQSMMDNLGFTLTPDSMMSFREAEWPLFVSTLLTLAGNTLYPVFLRLILWIMSKVVARTSATQESLQFLLDHPRRCYMLLFPRGTTWALFGIILVLNFMDSFFILILDLNNPQVTSLPPGPRVMAAIFQAGSSRHTGASVFNLATVSPAVQFSLLVMMYISAFPVALSIRASNTYEEKSLGIYQAEAEENLDEDSARSYLGRHLQSQLSFDLWYIFLGIFILSISEADKIVHLQQPSFGLFPIFFEAVSAYGNVGLSLGYPNTNASLSTEFSTLGKLVICAMMIRGRHRGLPYALDRAIMLPDEHLLGAATRERATEEGEQQSQR